MVEDEDGGEIVLTLRTFIGVTDSFLRQTSANDPEDSII